MEFKTVIKLKLNKYISYITAFLIVFAGIAAFPLKTDASPEKIDALSLYNQYFRRTIGSFARADMYKYDVLASLTVAQAIHESAWGTSTLATTSNNLFGMTVGSTWEGKVNYRGNICKNADEAIMFRQASTYYMWRVYDSWVESIEDHGKLIGTSDTYKNVKGVKDYKTACENIAEKYAPPTDPANKGYSDKLIYYIENYDLTEFDNLNPNEYGVIAITMSDAKKELSVGSTYKLSANIIGTTTEQLVWATTDNSIAEVSQDGTVTAKGVGTVLITASIGNREACCIVVIGYNAKVINIDVGSSLNVREKPVNGTPVGKLKNAQYIAVVGKDETTGWYQVIGTDSDGKVITGYSSPDYIELLEEKKEVTNIAFNRYVLNRDVNRTYQLKYAVAPTFAENQTLTWTSSDPSVASVENGLITTHNYGTATITATAASGVSKSCVVNVTNKTVKYKAMAVTELYVRSEDRIPAKTTDNVIGRFTSGTVVTITDNYCVDGRPISDDFYYAEGKMKDGSMGAGFSTAQYIFLMEEVPDDPEIPTVPIPDDYQFNDNTLVVKNGYLYGIPYTSTADKLLERIADASAVIYGKDGNPLSATGRVGTGCTLELQGENQILKATIVIKGDVDGNGKLDQLDLLKVKRALINNYTLEGPYLLAACTGSNGTFNSMDYLRMKKHILGNYEIKQSVN